MRFEMETTYEQPTVRAFQNILNRTVRAKRIRLVRILTFVVGCGALAYGLLWLWAAVAEGVSAVPAVSGLAAGTIFLLLGIFYKKYINRSGRHMVNQQPVTIRYAFDCHGYSTLSGKNRQISPYRIIHDICSGDGYYVIMLDRRRGFVLDKSRFLSGDPEKFAPFLEERTGKPIQTA